MTSGFDRAQQAYDYALPPEDVPCDDGHHSIKFDSHYAPVEFDGDSEITAVCADCGASAVFILSGRWEL